MGRGRCIRAFYDTLQGIGYIKEQGGPTEEFEVSYSLMHLIETLIELWEQIRLGNRKSQRKKNQLEPIRSSGQR